MSTAVSKSENLRRGSTRVRQAARVMVETLEARELMSATYDWQNVPIGGGGFVTGIVTCPTQKDTVYARTDVGGAYKWDPVDHRWNPLTDWRGRQYGNTYGIESIAIDPTHPDTVYMSAGEYVGNQYWPGAYILRTTDGGRNFTTIDVGSWTTGIRFGANEAGRFEGERMVVDPNNSSVIYYGTRDRGLWKSTNSALNWAKVAGFPTPGTAFASYATGTGVRQGNPGGVVSLGVSFVVFDKASVSAGVTQTIFAGVAQASGTTLYRSDNAGATWSAVSGGPGTVPNTNGMNFLPNHAALASNGFLYISYGDLAGPNEMENGAVWRYNTSSRVWKDITPLQPQAVNSAYDKFGYTGVSVDAQDPSAVIVSTMDRWTTNDRIFRTTTADASTVTWTGMNAGRWMGDVEIDPFDSNRAWFVTGSGLSSTNNLTAADTGGTVQWTKTVDGLEETVVLDLNSPTAGAPLISALGDIQGYRHASLATAPTVSLKAGGGNIDSLDSEGLTVAFVGSDASNPAQISTDGGVNWKSLNLLSAVPGAKSGTIAVNVSGTSCTAVWSLPNGASYSSSSTNYTGSTPTWTNWTQSVGLPSGVRVVADHKTASTFYGYAYTTNASNGTLYVSTDGGKTFTTRNSTVVAGAGTPVISFAASGVVWLPASDNGLYRSTNAGSTFTQLTGVSKAYLVALGRGAPGTGVPAVFIYGVVAGVTGIFRSDDNGSTWVRINDDQHQYGGIGVLEGDPRCYGRVYLGTSGRGVVYGELSDTHPFADGVYSLTSVNSNLQLDDPGTATTTQMIQSAPAITNSQKWQFIYNGFGYYTIKNVNSGLVLDSKGNKTAGQPLVQYSNVANDNLLWSFENVNTSAYVIRNKSTNFVIDINQASASVGAGAILYTKTGQPNQQWRMAPAAIASSQPFADGVYTFKNLLSGLAMDVPANDVNAQILQNTGDTTTSEQWRLTYVAAGYYTVTNVATGYALNSSGSPTSGTPLRTWWNDGSSNLQWSFQRSGSGWLLRNKATGLYAGVAQSSTTVGAGIDLRTLDAGNSQIWDIQYAV